MNILLIEDEAISALDISRRLENFGHTILATASTGEEAVEYDRKLDPDLILMDIKLKGEMDGIDAAREIGRRRTVPIVFLTAYSDTTTLKRSMSIAPHGYVLKPVNDRDLFATLEAALIRRTLEKDLEHRLGVEKMFSRVAAMAAASVSVDEFLPDSLRIVGETMDVSRAYYLEYRPDRKAVYNTHEWCAPGVESAVEIMNGQPAVEGDYFYDMLSAGRCVAVCDVENIEDPGAYELVRRQGIRAMALFPVASETELLGMIGFDECRGIREWKDEELKTLVTMVNLLTGMFRRLKSETRLQRQLDFEEILVRVSRNLLNATRESVDAVIVEGLKHLGNLVGADRSYIFRFERGKKIYNNTHEWCAGGIRSYREQQQHRDGDTTKYFYSRLKQDRVYIVEDVGAMPEEASVEREILLGQACRSIIILPVLLRGQLRGFLGLDSVREHRDWSDVDQRLLKIFGELCIGTLERMETLADAPGFPRDVETEESGD